MNEKFNKNAKVEKIYQHAGDSCPPNRYRSFQRFGIQVTIRLKDMVKATISSKQLNQPY